MDTYKFIWTRLQSKILRFLSIKAGDRFNLREIARALKVSPTAVSKSLNELKKEELIKIESSKKINLLSVEFNRDSRKAIDFKKTENLRLIYESGLSEFLFKEFPGCTIVLFGSYSRGEDTIESDIDIAIVEAKEKEIDLKKFDEFLEREIIINFYPSFKEIDKHLKNNILNGIILSGSVEL